MSKLTVKTLCCLAVFLMVFAAQAGAVPLNIASLDLAQLNVLRGMGAPITFLNSNYELAPADGAPPDDGTLTSQIFNGQNEAAGLFVYMYSMTNLAAAGSVNAMNIAFGNLLPATIVPGATLGAAGYVGPSFEVFSFDSTGTGVAPSAASWIAGDLNISFVGNGSIPAGMGSTFYGVFSPLPPQTVIANLLGGAAHPVQIQPNALGIEVQTPEPGTLLFLGLGLAGVAFYGKRRRSS